MKSKRTTQLVWALKLCFVLFLVEGIIMIGTDMAQGFKDGWNESRNTDDLYPSEDFLSFKKIKKATMAENDHYRITGISQVIVQQKKTPLHSFQKFIIMCLQL